MSYLRREKVSGTRITCTADGKPVWFYGWRADYDQTYESFANGKGRDSSKTFIQNLLLSVDCGENVNQPFITNPFPRR